MHMIPGIVYMHMIPGTCTSMYAGIVHAAAAAELVVWGHEVHPKQQTQAGPPHRENHKSPRIMSTSEGRASKKANIVDNESLHGDSSDGVGRIIGIYLVRHPGKYLLARGTWCGGVFFI